MVLRYGKHGLHGTPDKRILEDLFTRDPALMGAIVGGLLTTSGAVAINAYQNYRENRNLKRALSQEIRRTDQVLGPLAALHELYTEGEVDLNNYEGAEEFQWPNGSRELVLDEIEDNSASRNKLRRNRPTTYR